MSVCLRDRRTIAIDIANESFTIENTSGPAGAELADDPFGMEKL